MEGGGGYGGGGAAAAAGGPDGARQAGQAAAAAAAQQFFCHMFFKVDPKWRWMADLAKEESAKEAEVVLRASGVRLRTYSTLGLRDDADFLLWFAADTVDEIQGAAARLYRTVFGKYIVPSRTYLSRTRPSLYLRAGGGGGAAGAGAGAGAAGRGAPPSFAAGNAPKKYAVVYPFTKSREWYLLSAEQRRDMMDEHIAVGQKYPGIVLNTTYAFGIHDEDFMLSFECDSLAEFQDLVMELRETAVSRYVAVDTPMIVCVSKDIIPLVMSLG